MVTLMVWELLQEGAFALAKAHYASSGDDIASSIIERVRCFKTSIFATLLLGLIRPKSPP